MAAADYKGWLLEIEGTKLPMKYIAHNSYGASPDQKQDATRMDMESCTGMYCRIPERRLNGIHLIWFI